MVWVCLGSQAKEIEPPSSSLIAPNTDTTLPAQHALVSAAAGAGAGAAAGVAERKERGAHCGVSPCSMLAGTLHHRLICW